MKSAQATLPPRLSRALASYKRRLSEAFGARLELCALFGSWARGEQHAHSDCDVLVLIRGASRRELDEAVGTVADVDLETEVWLTPKAYSAEQFERLQAVESPFARAIMEDAIPV